MVYAQNAAFQRDKQQFFSQIPTSKDPATQLQLIDGQVHAMDYSFVLTHQKSLESEFTALFDLLNTKNPADKSAFWLYCYYCASLLEQFYKAYEQKSKEAEYKTLKAEIKKHLYKEPIAKQSEQPFIDALKQSFIASFRNVINSPYHIAQVRDYVAYVNLCRLYWVFNRLTFVQGLKVAKDLQWLDKLDAIMGTHTDVDKIIRVIQAPNFILNYCSVAFFLIRFSIDSGLLIKHTFFPTQTESKATTWARFKYELYKRHCNFANDLVWATVNFLTNFNHISGIPDPVAAYLTSVFLLFDVGMALYKANLAYEDYLTKKNQYTTELKCHSSSKHSTWMTMEQRLTHISVLNQQLEELELNWKTTQATFHFVAAAAAQLMLGFTLATVVANPVLVPLCFFLTSTAAAMYLSVDAYGLYTNKSLKYETAQRIGANTSLHQKEYELARAAFIVTMTKNTVTPLLLITTYALCWPAAIALTALYVGHELVHGHQQHEGKKALRKLALAHSEEESDYTSKAPL